MQLIQLNLNRCRAAQDLLKQMVRELGSEVDKNRGNNMVSAAAHGNPR